MEPAMATDLKMGNLSTPNPMEQYLELVKNGDVSEFRAEMVKHPLDISAGPDIFEGRTPLHMAALHGQVEIAKHILASPDISVHVVNAKDRFGYTPLHLAVRSEHEDVVRILTASSLTSSLTSRFLAATSDQPDERAEDCDGFSPLHIGATVGNVDRVKLLLQQSCQDRPVNIHATTWQGMTALDVAETKNHGKLVDVLESYDVKWLQLERQKSANSVNAILVGAALVVTVAFASLMQPPLGIPSDENSSRGSAPSTSPSTSPSSGLIDRVHTGHIDRVQICWFLVFTSFSLACSVVSLVIGTTALIPHRGASLENEVHDLRRSVLRASNFLFVAIFFLVLAWQTGSRVVSWKVVSGRVVMTVWIWVSLLLPIVILAFVLSYTVLLKGRDAKYSNRLLCAFIIFAKIFAISIYIALYFVME